MATGKEDFLDYIVERQKEGSTPYTIKY